MGLLLCLWGGDFVGETAEFVLRPLDLVVQLPALRAIYFNRGSSQSPVGSADDGYRYVQVAHQRSHPISRRWIGFTLPLRFQKQLRLLQNPLADGRRGFSPSGIQLPRLSAAESVLGQRLCHALAGFEARARHWHQKLHGHMGRDGAAAHVLLHAFG
jgi:hypothetical protein